MMKRLIILTACMSFLYAGALWAMEGCVDFSADVHAGHHAKKTSHDHYDANTASHHSHTDPSKIHCANILGEFLISSRPALLSPHSNLHHVAHEAWAIAGVLLSGSVGLSERDGPPGSIRSRMFPRHLLLSVIRI